MKLNQNNLLRIICIFSFQSLILSFTSLASDSLQFQLDWEYLTFPALPQTIVFDQEDRPNFYAALKTGGLQVYEALPGQEPTPGLIIPTTELGDLQVMNAFQQGQYLYLALGNFFGSDQQKAGLGIIDISNPNTPIVTDYWSTDTIVKGSAVVIVEGDYAYLGAMNQGLMIFDVSDKDNINRVSHFIPDVNFPEENPPPVREPNARGMDIKNDLLFLCYDAGGIRVIDVSDKANPIEVANYINEGAIHKQQAYNNIILNEELAYVAVDYCGVEILDISDIQNIEQIGWWNPWNCEGFSNVWLNSPGHTNQLVYIEDKELVFLSAGGSELVAVDVSNPTDPVLCGSYGEPGNQLGVWGVEVKENFIFLSYINALIPFVGTWSGIKILNWDIISNQDNLEASLPEIKIYPNPFQNRVDFNFNLETSTNVQIEAYNIKGQLIKTWPDKRYYAGFNHLVWETTLLSSGVYVLKIQTEKEVYNYKIFKK